MMLLAAMRPEVGSLDKVVRVGRLFRDGERRIDCIRRCMLIIDRESVPAPKPRPVGHVRQSFLRLFTVERKQPLSTGMTLQSASRLELTPSS